MAADVSKGRWIIVDLPAHRISVYEDGILVNTILHFSIGRLHYLTPIDGDYKIYKRLRTHRSSEFPKPHGGAPMPFSLFFKDGAAFHAGSVHVESHGCVHLNYSDAEWLFNWAGTYEVNVRFIGPYSHKHGAIDTHLDWKYA